MHCYSCLKQIKSYFNWQYAKVQRITEFVCFFDNRKSVKRFLAALQKHWDVRFMCGIDYENFNETRACSLQRSNWGLRFNCLRSLRRQKKILLWTSVCHVGGSGWAEAIQWIEACSVVIRQRWNGAERLTCSKCFKWIKWFSSIVTSSSNLCF